MKNKAYGRLSRDNCVENIIFFLSKVVSPTRANISWIVHFPLDSG